ncbi:hypothetical protein [Pseudovibrio sp. SPO723]|uniref:hypothetical protein n=1 Tax=Nesiotobacter zosterae TaxID=392721 RepID=UPI0029C5A32A|nr:hypothetical protein [Pseudovibrio sp. SPO723]MDX5592559.1 hypothetical protein [Pseudovibrio sp. SPO723]
MTDLKVVFVNTPSQTPSFFASPTLVFYKDRLESRLRRGSETLWSSRDKTLPDDLDLQMNGGRSEARFAYTSVYYRLHDGVQVVGGYPALDYLQSIDGNNEVEIIDPSGVVTTQHNGSSALVQLLGATIEAISFEDAKADDPTIDFDAWVTGQRSLINRYLIPMGYVGDDYLHKLEAEHISEHLPRQRLHHAPVGTVVEAFYEYYGLDVPDNLWPMDGSVINHPKAHPAFAGKSPLNLLGDVLAGTNEAAGYNQEGSTYGNSTLRLSSSNIPRLQDVIHNKTVKPTGSVSVNVYNYNGSRSTTTNTALPEDIDDVVPRGDPDDDLWDSYDGLGGTGNSAFTGGGGSEKTSRLNHSHTVNLSHGHGASATLSMTDLVIPGDTVTVGSSNPTPINLHQPTTLVGRYIVIY